MLVCILHLPGWSGIVGQWASQEDFGSLKKACPRLRREEKWRSFPPRAPPELIHDLVKSQNVLTFNKSQFLAFILRKNYTYILLTVALFFEIIMNWKKMKCPDY